MEGRGQFTFYRSFYEAVCDLPMEVRLGVYEAIMVYALDKKEPEKLEGVQKTAFTLIKPVLDASWKKAMAGMNSGKSRRTKREQNANKGEKENEIEQENEIENEKELETETEDECPGSVGFEQFWALYPVKLGKDKAYDAWKRFRPDAQAACDGVKKWLQTNQWKKDNGRFIPRAAKFLEEGHYTYLPGDHIPQGASGVLGQAELEAVARLMEGK